MNRFVLPLNEKVTIWQIMVIPLSILVLLTILPGCLIPISEAESIEESFEISGAHLKAFEPAYRYFMQSSLPAKEKNLQGWTVTTFEDGNYYLFHFMPSEMDPKKCKGLCIDERIGKGCWVKKKNYEVVTAPAYGQND